MTTHPQPYGNQPPPPPPPGFGPPPQLHLTGPEFMAVDRRNSIVVDAEGVTFEINDISADFPWPEIRSVHYKPGPSGRHLMMAVVHLDGTFYECVVEAKPRTRLTEWLAHLGAVLGHYRPMG
ncbi:hypothetical protein [Streptomyces lincolnensis]|nr:hypothetical protein [Streptomyces lincolnensis]QMV09270.1 hypothetical protein GJU35_28895 [Streptomyces lincolnensis]